MIPRSSALPLLGIRVYGNTRETVPGLMEDCYSASVDGGKGHLNMTFWRALVLMKVITQGL